MELKKIIPMLQNPELDSKDIDPDLHQRMDKAVQDGSIKCFNMRESEADGDQDLHLWAREMEDVVRGTHGRSSVQGQPELLI